MSEESDKYLALLQQDRPLFAKASVQAISPAEDRRATLIAKLPDTGG